MTFIKVSRKDMLCFQHDMGYTDFKDLDRRTFADKVIHDKAFDIVKDPKYDEHQGELALMVYKIFDKIISGSGIKNENISNKKLAKENLLLENLIKEK